MFVGADDASVLRFAFDTVDVGDEFERLFDFGMFALLIQLATSARETSGTLAAAGLRHRVVAGILVDHETPLGIAEHFVRHAAAARHGVAIDDQLRRHKAPQKRAPLDVLLPHAGLIGCVSARAP